MGKLEYVNADDFEEKVLKSDVPVLIDFYADWCGPCKMMEPALEEAADQFAGKLKIYKLNVDDNPYLAAQYQIMSIPAMLFFKDGAPVHQIIGAVNRKKLFKEIMTVIGGE